MSKIHPETLKAILKRKLDERNRPWTLAKLAEVSGLGLATIKRAAGGNTSQNQNTLKKIASALGVKPEELSSPPDKEKELRGNLRKRNFHLLKAAIDVQTAWNFDANTLRYGLSMQSQLALAPLAIALLAEGSLAARREQISEIEIKVQELIGAGNGHLSFARRASRVEEGIFCEKASIAKRDLLGARVSGDAFDEGYVPSENNPFVAYLEEFAHDLGLDCIDFWANGNGLRDDGLPDYWIGDVDEVAGPSGRARMAIEKGYVRRKDIPSELTADERIARIEAAVPDREWEDHLRKMKNLEISLDERKSGGTADA